MHTIVDTASFTMGTTFITYIGLERAILLALRVPGVRDQIPHGELRDWVAARLTGPGLSQPGYGAGWLKVRRTWMSGAVIHQLAATDPHYVTNVRRLADTVPPTVSIGRLLVVARRANRPVYPAVLLFPNRISLPGGEA